MKKVIMMVAIVMATGCATVNSLRSGNPVASGQTKKSAQSYSACVAEKWNGTYFNATSVPLENGFSIQILNDIAGSDAVVDVREASGVTTYSLFERAPLLTSKKIANAVEDCK